MVIPGLARPGRDTNGLTQVWCDWVWQSINENLARSNIRETLAGFGLALNCENRGYVFSMIKGQMRGTYKFM